jgi:hypothetical protein
MGLHYTEWPIGAKVYICAPWDKHHKRKIGIYNGVAEVIDTDATGQLVHIHTLKVGPLDPSLLPEWLRAVLTASYPVSFVKLIPSEELRIRADQAKM